jgi:hypothetical protein
LYEREPARQIRVGEAEKGWVYYQKISLFVERERAL